MLFLNSYLLIAQCQLSKIFGKVTQVYICYTILYRCLNSFFTCLSFHWTHLFGAYHDEGSIKDALILSIWGLWRQFAFFIYCILIATQCHIIQFSIGFSSLYILVYWDPAFLAPHTLKLTKESARCFLCLKVKTNKFHIVLRRKEYNFSTRKFSLLFPETRLV